MLELHVYLLDTVSNAGRKMSEFVKAPGGLFVTIDPSKSRADRFIKGTCDTLQTFHPGPTGQGVTK